MCLRIGGIIAHRRASLAAPEQHADGIPSVHSAIDAGASNVWRKHALGRLLREAHEHGAGNSGRDPMQRLCRFDKSGASLPMNAASSGEATLNASVNLFREPLGQLHDLSSVVPMVSFFADKVETMVGEHAAFAPPGSAGAARVAEVQQKAKQSSQQEQQRKNSRGWRRLW